MTQDSMSAICRGLETGQLSSDSVRDVIEQLAVEGQRRIDAFVFELMFKQQLQQIARDRTGLSMAFGWHIGYNKCGEPQYWFRLMDRADDWSQCDQQMREKLERLKVGLHQDAATLIRARFDSASNRFLGSISRHDGWEEWACLATLLKKLPGKGSGREPRAMSNAAPSNMLAAFDRLQMPRLRHELTGLSIQRRFMNCLLGPHLGRDGTDLDAVAMGPDGRLRCIEFKRKYPARGKEKFFGLDVWPHVNTIETLASVGIESLHVILVGPIWEKRQSPVEWLNDRSLDPHWTWLAANLDEQAFETAVLHTSGTDSGHRPQERDQRSISWQRIRVLNAGLTFEPSGREALLGYLEGSPAASGQGISYQDLYDRRVR